MPIYEYYCDQCKQIKSEIQKFSDEPLTDCDKCGAVDSLSKLISKSAFHLKGSGWYAKDSKVDSTPIKPAASASTDSVKTDQVDKEKNNEKVPEKVGVKEEGSNKIDASKASANNVGATANASQAAASSPATSPAL